MAPGDGEHLLPCYIGRFDLITVPTQTTTHRDPSSSSRAIKAGDLDLAAWFHRGAIVSNVLGGQDLVIEGWGEQGGQLGALVVACDDQGVALPGEQSVLETSAPSAFTHRHGSDPKSPNSRVMVRSANPIVPSGMRSNDPALLLVPFGSQAGRMLGQLNEAELQRLKEEAGSELLKKAIGEVSPSSLGLNPTSASLSDAGATPRLDRGPGVAEEAHQRVERQAREMRQRDLTQQIKTVPLTRVIEDIYGISGEKSGARSMKYRVGDALILVCNDTNSFGGLNGHEFQAFRGKSGSKGAIDLVIACAEAEGRNLSFKEAREIVQRTFLPSTLGETGAKRPKLDLKVGQVNPAVWFHKGAVIQDLDAGAASGPTKAIKVIEPWSTATKAARIIDCDLEGSPLNGSHGNPTTRELRVDNLHPTALDLAVGPGKSPGFLIRSENAMIRPGLRSDDPSLQLVPFGPFGGMMLGQLNEEQLAHIKKETSSGRLQAAIARTKPSLFAPGANEPKGERDEPTQEIPIELPPRITRLQLPTRGLTAEARPYTLDTKNGLADLDNLRITRDYLIQRRKLRPDTVDAALEANAAYPTESVVYRKDAEGNPTEEVLFRHPAICIPIAGLKTQEPIAYQLKVIYLDPALAKKFKGNDSYNFGPVTRGFAMVGSLHPGTQEVTLTEAWIDAMSKWDLHQFGPEHCVMATTGSRMPRDLIEECKARGIPLHTAMDNDGTGRKMAEKIRVECAKAGVKGEDQIVAPSEFVLGLKDNAAGKVRLDETKRFCAEHRIMHIVEPTKNGWVHVTIDNSSQSATYLDEVKRKDSVARQQEKREEKHVVIEVRNKDWNDLVKGDYRRSFSRDFERSFLKASPGEDPRSSVRKRATELSMSAGPSENEKVSATVSDLESMAPAAGSGKVTEKDAIGVQVAITGKEGLTVDRFLTDASARAASTTLKEAPPDASRTGLGTAAVTHGQDLTSESFDDRQLRRLQEPRPKLDVGEGPSLC